MSIVLVFATLCTATMASNPYEGYRILKLYPSTKHQFELVGKIGTNFSIDFLSQTADAGSTVMVTTDEHIPLVKILDDANIPHKLIAVNAARLTQRAQLRRPQNRINFNEFNRYKTIENYLNRLEKNYSQIVSLERIGKSYEGRNLTMIKIGAGNKNNPIILVDAGIHAREWISPAFALYLIRELVTNKKNEQMIKSVNWFIIPLLNPDGYEYSHRKVRLWRKTRSEGKKFKGVDANRNFGFHWNKVGASNREKDSNYAGPNAFSESETRALRDLVLKYPKKIQLYLTFHSAGRYLLFPWGYTTALPQNSDELRFLGKKVASAIASVSGTKYTVGSSTNVLYPAAGGSDDWVMGVGGVPLTYTVELPEGGMFGFDIPAWKIKSVCVETFKGVKIFHKYIDDKGNTRR